MDRPVVVIVLTVVGLASLGYLAHRSPQAGVLVPPVSDEDRAPIQQVSRATAGLTERLLPLLAAAEKGRNVAVSPYGLHRMLSCVRLGAAGQTERDLGKALGTERDAAKTLADMSVFDRTLDALTQTGRYAEASGLVLDPMAAPSDQTTQSAATHGVPIERAGFPEPATSLVNRRVAEATAGLIPSVLDALSPGTGLVAYSALAFRDEWAVPFDGAKTLPASFSLADGTTTDVFTMYRDGPVGYLGHERWDAITLAYSSGLYMVLALPRHGVPLVEALRSELPWTEVPRPYPRDANVRVYLPRWRTDYEWDVRAWMIGDGLAGPFSPGADFSAFGLRGGFVSSAKQRTKVEVNERGTVVASVTEGEVAKAAYEREPPSELRFDRPFAYAVMHPGGVPLVAGIVSDPRE